MHFPESAYVKLSKTNFIHNMSSLRDCHLKKLTLRHDSEEMAAKSNTWMQSKTSEMSQV